MAPTANDDNLVQPVDIHPALWLWLPLGSLALSLLAPLLAGDSRQWWLLMMDETGFWELATVALLIPAAVVSVLIFRRRAELPRVIGAVMLLAGIAALYFAGEELSWGQHHLGYETPESVAKYNRQREFNLHNIKGWSIFNNVPRQIMFGLCAAGGILAVVLHKRLSGPQARKGPWYWLIPTWRLVPICFLAVGSTWPEKLLKHFRPPLRGTYLSLALVEPAGEFKEYCYAIVMLLYLLSVYLRMGVRRVRAA